MMAKRYYNLFADAIGGVMIDVNAMPGVQDRFVGTMVARNIADLFAVIAQGDNPRFDRARFIKACGFTD